MISKRWQIALYAVWLILLVAQASCIELMSDEAYYWRYSQQLDWGYLDHPPMIALLIKIGSSIFGGELGVRILPILLGVGSVYIWQCIVRPSNEKLFFALVLSVGLLHFLSLMAIPDAPLLFFGSLFLLFYKKSLEAPRNLWNFIGIGIAVGCLLLSKYHGVLLVLFVLFSNLRLLLNYRFWVAVVIGALVFLPHALWQINHDFISLRFHMSERSFEPYHLEDTLEYIVTQLFVLGPISGFLFIIAVAREKTQNQFERTLKIVFWGVLIFFFFMTFKGNVEGHWTFISIIPALYFGQRYFEKKAHWIRRMKVIGISVFALAFLTKGVLMIDLSQWAKMPLVYSEWQSNKARSKAIAARVGERPVGFMNSYQKAALYEFYTGNPAFSLSNALGRRDQYGVWETSQHYLGKEVVVIANYYEKEFDSIAFRKECVSYRIATDFSYYANLELDAMNMKSKLRAGETISVRLKIDDKLPRGTQLNSAYPCEIRWTIFEGENFVYDGHFAMVAQEWIGKELVGYVTFPKAPGAYRIQFSVKSGWIPAARSDRYWKFVVG